MMNPKNNRAQLMFMLAAVVTTLVSGSCFDSTDKPCSDAWMPVRNANRAFWDETGAKFPDYTAGAAQDERYAMKLAQENKIVSVPAPLDAKTIEAQEMMMSWIKQYNIDNDDNILLDATVEQAWKARFTKMGAAGAAGGAAFGVGSVAGHKLGMATGCCKIKAGKIVGTKIAAIKGTVAAGVCGTLVPVAAGAAALCTTYLSIQRQQKRWD